MIQLPQLPAPAAVLVGGAGLIQMTRNAWKMWQGDGSIDWPTVQGVVQRSRVEHRIPGRFHVTGIPIYQKPGGYEVVVEYAYLVEGHTYVSDRWSFDGGLMFSEEEAALTKARQYRETTVVTVHYDPSDPRSSTLKTGEHQGATVGALIAGTSFLYALYSLMTG